eukprot:CAMPEP_0174715970 /NCGR_PEP_ID=MMETSP1094-20130205/22714_1 /TAXON_ID=156173 /ORGANISM="Chrysochromulina brevifilum, Strain UTEX LB 985" /LENGTH=172 /DNA_ID=CAMNT_0015915639 /DNA_START=655 /DNA_END=1175 /DNA_ORIENTATION=-
MVVGFADIFSSFDDTIARVRARAAALLVAILTTLESSSNEALSSRSFEALLCCLWCLLGEVNLTADSADDPGHAVGSEEACRATTFVEASLGWGLKDLEARVRQTMLHHASIVLATNAVLEALALSIEGDNPIEYCRFVPAAVAFPPNPQARSWLRRKRREGFHTVDSEVSA